MPRGYKEALLSYELPPTIRSLQKGWQLTCQSGAVVSALLAAAAAQLLTFFKDDKNYDPLIRNAAGTRTFLLLLCYASILFNASASISSFILIDRLGELPFRAAQKRQSTLPKDGSISASPDYLLKRFGVGALWTCVMWHWLFCYLAGIWCIILQILTYVWLQESRAIQIALTCLGGFSMLPLIVFVVPSFLSRAEVPNASNPVQA